MSPIRGLLAGTAGKAVAIAIAVVAVSIAIFMCVSFFKGETPDFASYTTYVCSETNKSFRHKNIMGETLPILSPYSGKNTGYPGEACYWNADGTLKEDPTWVLLNEATGKSGQTFCPDCGRLVVGHNPHPKRGAKAPPLRAEISSRSQSASTSEPSYNAR